MRVVGIDPGLRITGWGIIDSNGAELRHVANGVCRSEGSGLAERLKSIYLQLVEVLQAHQPDEAAVEQMFVNANVTGSLKLGHARAVALLAAANAGLPVGEYAPNTVKKVVVGVGHAQKNQVEHMVRLQLPGADFSSTDAADALAVAITHAVTGNFAKSLPEAVFAAGPGT